MEIKNMTFSYDGKKNILEDINIKIKTGKITTFIGANGCGKSTLLHVMSKNLRQKKGKVILDGKDIRQFSVKEFAKKVAMVHQKSEAPEDLLVQRLVSYGRNPYEHLFGKGKKENQDIVDWAMEATGIKDFANQEMGRLSGGQRQRAFIAMGLAQKTDYLFLDEPTTYLDIRYQIEILELVQRLNQEYGLTIVMVLHDMNHAIYYSHEVIGLKDRKIVMQGSPVEVVTEERIQDIFGIHLNVKTYDNRVYVDNIRKIQP